MSEILSELDMARLLLASSEWRIIRKSETGVEVPQEVLNKRAEARQIINNALLVEEVPNEDIK